MSTLGAHGHHLRFGRVAESGRQQRPGQDVKTQLARQLKIDIPAGHVRRLAASSER